MPSWKKVITSGSNAVLSDITASGDFKNTSGNFTLDVAGDIILDADNADVILKDNGTEFGRFSRVSSDLVIKSATSNKDILFKGNDGGATITALQLDMSEGGDAIFSGNVNCNKAFTVTQTSTSISGANNIDLSAKNNYNLTLTGDVTLTPTNLSGREGQSGLIALIQDSSGGHSITLNSLFKTPRGDSIAFDTTADGISLMSYYVVNTSNVAVNYLGPFS